MSGPVQEDPLVQTWHCKLPVRVVVAPNSISSPTALPPFYMLAPRQGYVSFISNQIWPMVQHVLPKLPGNAQPRPWLDYRGIPLKSTVPLGVLFDCLTSSSSSSSSSNAAAGHPAAGSISDEDVLPWHLTLHYTHAPPDVCVSWLASLPPQAQLLNSLKEACHICKGTDGSAAVMRMDGTAQDALWSAIEKCDVSQYRMGLASLKVIPSPRAQGSIPPAIPVRVLLRQPASLASSTHSTHAGGTQQSLSVWDSVTCTCRPIPAVTHAGAWVTLGQALHALLPALFLEPGPAAGAAASGQPEQEPSQQQEGQEQLQEPEQAAVVAGAPPAPPPPPPPPAPSPFPSTDIASPASEEGPQEQHTGAAEAAAGMSDAGQEHAEAGSPVTAGAGGAAACTLDSAPGTASQGSPASVSGPAGRGSSDLQHSASEAMADAVLTGQAYTAEAPAKAAAAGMHSPASARVSDQASPAAKDEVEDGPGDRGPSPEVGEQLQGQGEAGSSEGTPAPQAELPALAEDWPAPGAAGAASSTPEAAGKQGLEGSEGGASTTGQHTSQSGGGAAEAVAAPAAAAPGMPGSREHAGSRGQELLALPLNLNASWSASLATAGLSQHSQADCPWLVCGIQPPLETPLAWLHAHMHAPDYFLYVVVRADLASQAFPAH